jgi:hypothetical protein
LISLDDPLRPFVKLGLAFRITDSGLFVASGADPREAEPSTTYLLTPTGVPAPAASPPPSSSDTDSGGGAVDLLSLLLLTLGLSSFARSQRVRRA